MSDGFYQAKIALIKYFIIHLSFRALAFEDNWNTAKPINDYILGTTNDAKAALLVLTHKVWHAISILELLQWIRHFNDTHETDKVVFFGFDMQDYHYSKNYLDRHETKYKKIAETTVNSYNERARQHKPDKDGYEGDMSVRIRDQAMAEIFLAMKALVAPKKKTIIWAANGHITKEATALPLQTSMGYFLSRTIPNEYAAFPIVASQFETWRSLTPGQKTAPKDSLEEWLESFGRDGLFVDFSTLTPQVLGISAEDFEKNNPIA